MHFSLCFKHFADMASLDLKLTLDFGEVVSINLPECLADKEVVDLLKALESKLGHHLPAEASDKIELLTGPTSCLLSSVDKSSATSSKGSGPSSSGTASAKKRFAAAVKVHQSFSVRIFCNHRFAAGPVSSLSLN